MSGQDLRILLRLVDAMDDRFDGRIFDCELLRLAASALNSLNPSASYDPGLAAAVYAVAALLNAATGNPRPAEPTYYDLRSALADLEELR
jgi:hypothetical protein